MKVLGPLKTDGVSLTAGPQSSRLIVFIFAAWEHRQSQLNSGPEFPEAYDRGGISAIIVIEQVSEPQSHEKLFGHLNFGE